MSEMYEPKEPLKMKLTSEFDCFLRIRGKFKTETAKRMSNLHVPLISHRAMIRSVCKTSLLI